MRVRIWSFGQAIISWQLSLNLFRMHSIESTAYPRHTMQRRELGPAYPSNRETGRRSRLRIIGYAVFSLWRSLPPICWVHTEPTLSRRVVGPARDPHFHPEVRLGYFRRVGKLVLRLVLQSTTNLPIFLKPFMFNNQTL